MLGHPAQHRPYDAHGLDQVRDVLGQLGPLSWDLLVSTTKLECVILVSTTKLGCVILAPLN